MKRGIILLEIITMTLLLASCAKEESGVNVPDYSRPVSFSSSLINEFEFKSTETSFVTGDFIGVFAGSPISRSNVKMRVNGSSLEYVDVNDRIYWATGQNTSSNFVAYQPWIEDGSFSSVSNKTRTWTVSADQSSGDNFNASDLKVANVDVEPETTVNLAFSHILSKVTLTITSQLASPLTKVELVNVINSGTIDLDDGSVSSPSDRTATVIAHQKSFDSENKIYVYEAILIPDATANPSIKITVEGGTTYTYTLSSSFALQSGKNSAASFTIIRPGLSAVFSSVTLSNWTDGNSATVSTEDRVKDLADNKWSIVGNIMGTSWDEDIMMSNPSDNTWKIDIYYNANEEFKFRYKHSWDDTRTIGAKNSDSNTDAVPISLGSDKAKVLKYNDYSYEGEDPGAKNMTIDTNESGWYTIYLHPYTHNINSNWPTVYIVKK